MTVTAVIVAYNSGRHLGRAVESCTRQFISTIVVDNNPADGTAAELARLPQVRVLANTTNRGFAGAVNQGASEAKTDLILLLNPDAALLTPIDPLLQALGEKGYSAAAGLLADNAGNPQKGFTFRRFPGYAALVFEVLGINRILPGNPVNRKYRCLDSDLTKPQSVEQPAGAFFLFRKADWERLGGFDEQFHPVWFEDVDFCRRLISAGGTIWFDPSVRASHFGGHSIQSIGFSERQRVWYASLLRYAAKHMPPLQRRFVAVAVAAAILPRMLAGNTGSAGGDRRESKFRNLLFIWRLAWRHFRTGESTAMPPGGKQARSGDSR